MKCWAALLTSESSAQAPALLEYIQLWDFSPSTITEMGLFSKTYKYRLGPGWFDRTAESTLSRLWSGKVCFWVTPGQRRQPTCLLRQNNFKNCSSSSPSLKNPQQYIKMLQPVGTPILKPGNLTVAANHKAHPGLQPPVVVHYQVSAKCRIWKTPHCISLCLHLHCCQIKKSLRKKQLFPVSSKWHWMSCVQ